MVVKAQNRRWQELEKSDIPLTKLAQHYEAYNRSEGKSQKTIFWYARVLTYFGEYLDKNNLPSTLGTLDLHTVREFILHLQTKKKWEVHPYVPNPGGNLATISVQTYVRALKAFFSWLHSPNLVIPLKCTKHSLLLQKVTRVLPLPLLKNKVL